jgi:hypothetical protein
MRFLLILHLSAEDPEAKKIPGFFKKLPGKWQVSVPAALTSLFNEAYGHAVWRPGHYICPGVQHSPTHDDILIEGIFAEHRVRLLVEWNSCMA